MSKRGAKTLPRPEFNEVKIWFQGGTGSGKTLLSNLIRETLQAMGMKVQTYQFGTGVPRESQIVDLTEQDISDVLTVKIDTGQELRKLLFRHEGGVVS